MTQQQRQNVSVATIVTIATLLGALGGGLLTAQKLGDDRYVRAADFAALKKDVEYLKAGVDRIERQIGSQPTASTIAFRKSSHAD